MHSTSIGLANNTAFGAVSGCVNCESIYDILANEMAKWLRKNYEFCSQLSETKDKVFRVLKMSSRLDQKSAFNYGETQCEKMCLAMSSPLGRIEIFGCEKGVHEIRLQENAVLQNGTAEASVLCEVCEATEEMTEPLKQCVAWLQAYFCEPWMIKQLPMPPFHHPLLEQASFTREVLWTLLRDVKFGEAVSYKQLADLAGNSKAARAVGGAMRSNPVPIIIPCHRVICSSGQTGNYTGGSHLKEWLLSHEKLQKEKLAY